MKAIAAAILALALAAPAAVAQSTFLDLLITSESTAADTRPPAPLRIENLGAPELCDNGSTYCRGVYVEVSAEDGRRFLRFGRPYHVAGGFVPEANLGLGHTGNFTLYFVAPDVHAITARQDGPFEIRAVAGPVQINCPTGTNYVAGVTTFQVCGPDGLVNFECGDRGCKSLLP